MYFFDGHTEAIRYKQFSNSTTSIQSSALISFVRKTLISNVPGFSFESSSFAA
jgi:molybdopterin biosynthesis enzyme MoaB